MIEVDWAKEWHKMREKCWWVRKIKEKGMTSEDYWDSYPDEILEADGKIVNYQDTIFEKIKPFLNREANVLDIGAGGGAYTIPFARMAKKVTAIEPSKGQTARLIKKAEGLSNIKIINKRWEEVKKEELEEYDLVNAAYCFDMPDIKEALEKMLSCTRKVIFLIESAGSSKQDVLPLILPGYHPPPDYICLYNLLYQLGVHANVEINTRHYLYPWDLLQKVWEYSFGITREQKEKALVYFQNRNLLINKNGALWVKCWCKDAVIWYEKKSFVSGLPWSFTQYSIKRRYPA